MLDIIKNWTKDIADQIYDCCSCDKEIKIYEEIYVDENYWVICGECGREFTKSPSKISVLNGYKGGLNERP